MVFYQRLSAASCVLPYIEMYEVVDSALLDESVDALCVVIETVDFSAIEEIFEGEYPKFQRSYRGVEWSLPSNHILEWLKQIRRIAEDNSGISSIVAHLSDALALGEETTRISATPYLETLHPIRRITQAQEFPEHFTDSLVGIYLKQLTKTLSEICPNKIVQEGGKRLEDIHLDREVPRTIKGFYKNGKSVDPGDLRNFTSAELEDVELETEYSREALWYSGGHLFPHRFETTMVHLAVGPLQRSFGPSYFSQPPVGSSLIPDTLNAHPAFAVEWSNYLAAPGRWQRVTSSEIEALMEWAEGVEIQRQNWWPDLCETDDSPPYKWDSKVEAGWPETKKWMIQRLSEVKENRTEVVWRSRFPEECQS